MIPLLFYINKGKSAFAVDIPYAIRPLLLAAIN